MRILISNDDGIHAEGIRTLEHTLREEWADHSTDIFVVAPDRNRSGASHSLTLDSPLRVKWLNSHRASIEGTPTDCVHLAITGLLRQEEPDMVISGINHGANLGDDVLYSGTIAAAVEGRFLGLPSIAISLVTNDSDTMHFETAAAVAKLLVRHTLEKPLPESTIFNVNVPNVPLHQLRGYKITRLGARHKAKPVIEKKDPRGRQVYWVGLAGSEQDAGEETDFHAIRHHYVSITPLKIDFTHYAVFDQVKEWLADLKK